MKLSNEVIEVLSNLEVLYPGIVRMPKLDRKLYQEVNKALEALGGKWDRRREGHVFTVEIDPVEEGDARPRIQARIDAAITLGEVTTNADLGFFQTPMPLGHQLASDAEIRPEHSVLEPSAGLGALYQAIIRYEPAFVALVERDPNRRRKLQLTVRNCDEVCEHDDFMDFDESEPYDRVVMNPPFAKIGKGDHLDHVQRAFSMLTPGGILVAVLPAGVTFRSDKRHIRFRAFFDKYGEITPLPEHAFRESGTDVRTVVLKAAKR